MLADLSFIHKPHFIQPDVPFRTAVAPDVELKDKEKRVDLQGQVVLVLSNRQKKCFQVFDKNCNPIAEAVVEIWYHSNTTSIHVQK